MSVGHLDHVLLTIYIQLNGARDLEITWSHACVDPELVGSCVPIHACRALSNPKWLFYPSVIYVAASLCRPLLFCPSR